MQQSTKDKKAFMLHIKGSNLRREAKSVGHKLFLATSEEDDARLWEKYSKLLQRARELEIKSGYSTEDSPRIKCRDYCKPVFDEAYIALTKELLLLNERMRMTGSAGEKRQLCKKIEAVKQKRWRTARFVDRETGKPIRVTLDRDGKPCFDMETELEAAI